MTARVCAACGTEFTNPVVNRKAAKYAGYRGYCPRCWRRWANHGFPAGGPPQGRVQHVGGSAMWRLEEYARLRSWGWSRERAAAAVGPVTRRTVERWEARLSAGEVAS